MTDIIKLEYFYNSDFTKPIAVPKIITYSPDIIVGIDSPVPIKTDTTVEKNHCKITKSGVGKYIQNLSNFGTYFKIKKGSSINIPYNVYILIGRTWILPNRVSLYEATIKFTNKNYEDFKIVNVGIGSTFVIGKDCTIVPSITISDDLEVSLNHLKIKFESDHVEVEDFKNGLGSTNGTWIAFDGGQYNEGVLDMRIGAQTFIRISRPHIMSTHPEFSFAPDYINTISGSTHVTTVKTDATVGLKLETVKLDSSIGIKLSEGSNISI